MSLNGFVFSEGKLTSSFEDLAELPELTSENDFYWIDIESTDESILENVAKSFSLHELTVEDCLTAAHSPKIEVFSPYIFLIFRGLNPTLFSQEEEKTEELEDLDEIERYTTGVSIYLSKNFVITHRMSEVAWLDAVTRQLKRLGDGELPKTPQEIVHRVVDILVDRFARTLNQVDYQIDRYEEQAIEQPEEFELSDVLQLKRALGVIRQVMRDQQVIISRLSSDAQLIKERSQRRYFRDVEDHALAAIKTISNQIEGLVSIRDVYFAMANVRLGDIMRILAVITTLAVPLNLVVGFYGMNFDAIPLLHDPYGFWLIVIFMVIVSFFMLIFFRKQRWI